MDPYEERISRMKAERSAHEQEAVDQGIVIVAQGKGSASYRRAGFSVVCVPPNLRAWRGTPGPPSWGAMALGTAARGRTNPLVPQEALIGV